MKSIQLSIFATTLGLCSFAQADFIGLKGDISYWNVDGKANIDEKNLSDQDIDTDGTVQLSAAFEHPIPLFPNVKAKYTKLDFNTEKDKYGITNTELKLDHTDLILYYEILDNVIDIDVGVGATRLNGDVKQFGQSFDVNEYALIFYTAAGVKLPFTGLHVKAEATYTNMNDVKIADAQAELQYDFIQSIIADVGLKAGYRILDVELDDMDKRDMKFEFKGPYIGLDAHF